MLFPDVRGEFGEVSLEQLAREHARMHPQLWTARSPLYTQPNLLEQYIATVLAQKPFSCAYGGYLEDRSTLWRGSYLESSNHFLHLGVDVMVPEGTRVALDAPGTVVVADTDAEREPEAVLSGLSKEPLSHRPDGIRNTRRLIEDDHHTFLAVGTSEPVGLLLAPQLTERAPMLGTLL